MSLTPMNPEIPILLALLGFKRHARTYADKSDMQAEFGSDFSKKAIDQHWISVSTTNRYTIYVPAGQEKKYPNTDSMGLVLTRVSEEEAIKYFKEVYPTYED